MDNSKDVLIKVLMQNLVSISAIRDGVLEAIKSSIPVLLDPDDACQLLELLQQSLVPDASERGSRAFALALAPGLVRLLLQFENLPRNVAERLKASAIRCNSVNCIHLMRLQPACSRYQLLQLP